MQGSLVHKKEIKLYNEIEYCPVGIHLFISTLMIAYIHACFEFSFEPSRASH